MRVLVAVPAHRVRCRVWTDETRDWSVIHEALMLALARDDWTLETLTAQTALPRQVVVAGLARLMRHRLTEVVVENGATRFRASPVGKGLVAAGTPLPRFPNEKTRWYSLVVERFAGECFFSREVKTISRSKLDAHRRNSEATAIVDLSGQEGEQSYQVTPELVADIVERGGDRRLLRIDGSSVFTNSDVFLAVPVLDGVPRLPPSAGADLRDTVIRAAEAAERRLSLQPVAPVARDARPDTFDPVRCNFRPEDLVIGGSVQRGLLENILAGARRRVIIHSTFVHDERFEAVRDAVRAACARGVAVDLLFGAGAEDPVSGRNVTSAKNIVSMISADQVMQGLVKMFMGTTGSHAKIVLADGPEGQWTGVVSSCNWLASPFQNTEVSAVLRHPLAVADLMAIMKDIVGRRHFANELANELALEARNLRRFRQGVDGNSSVTLLVGSAHEAIMRRASGEATGEMFFSTHRLGATARTGAVLPAWAAANRGVEVSGLWSQANRPMTKAEARTVQQEAAAEGIELANSGKIPIHGKILLWMPDNAVVTSQNWGSASSNDSFPASEVGVHIVSSGLANHARDRLAEIYPDLLASAAKGS